MEVCLCRPEAQTLLPSLRDRKVTGIAPPGRVPASIHRLSRRLLGVARSILHAPHSCHSLSNLADDELAALHSLRSDPQLVVRPADKGGRWVVMDTDAYATDCLRQLQEQDFCRLLTSPLSEPHLDPSQTHRGLMRSGFISNSELRFLTPSASPKLWCFSILPKVHKSLWP